MLDLVGAIRQKLDCKMPPPADSADSAETAQPRALEPADSLRKIADSTADKPFPQKSATNPQPPKTGNLLLKKGFQDLSANPQNPQPPADKTLHNPDALLLEIAPVLGADPAHLRAFLADSDLQDIIEGEQNRASLLAFYRMKQQTGELLADHTPEPTRAPQSRPGHVELMQAWKPAHDALINHLMACRACYAPRDRYCTTGAELRRAYRQAC